MGALSNLFGAQTKQKAQIAAVVFRMKGSRFLDANGKEVIVPGGEWREGREGKSYDLGVISEAVVTGGPWAWLKTQLRMKLEVFLKKFQGGSR